MRRDSRCVDTIRRQLTTWETGTTSRDDILEQLRDIIGEYQPFTYCDACGNQLAGEQRRYCSLECVTVGNAAAAARRREAVVEEVVDLLDHGLTPREVLRALGMRPEALTRALYRADRNDLACQFSPLAQEERRTRKGAA